MARVFFIPNGPKNLATIFPKINFDEVAEYYVEVLDSSKNPLATSTINKMGCCCTDENVRIHFLNYLGTYDAIDFMKPVVTHEVISEEFKKSLPAVPKQTDAGLERTNVSSNDTKLARNNCYGEADMDWIQELMDSPKAYEEWKGIQSQADSYLPVRITDAKFAKQKNEKEYNYDFFLEYKMGNESKGIRN